MLSSSANPLFRPTTYSIYLRRHQNVGYRLISCKKVHNLREKSQQTFTRLIPENCACEFVRTKRHGRKKLPHMSLCFTPPFFKTKLSTANQNPLFSKFSMRCFLSTVCQMRRLCSANGHYFHFSITNQLVTHLYFHEFLAIT